MRKWIGCLLAVVMLFTCAAAASAEDRIEVAAKKIATAPTIDGVITEAEWGAPFVTLKPTDDEVMMGDGEKEALMDKLPTDIKLYVRWDDNNLYVGAQVTDKTHFNTFTGNSIWEGDSFELDFGVSTANQAARWRTNTGLSTADNKTYSYIYGKPNAALDGVDGFDADRKGEAKVARSGDVTTYELTFPWKDYAPTDADIKEGYSLILNFQFHIADGSTGADNSKYLGCIRYGTPDADNKVQYPLIKLAAADGNAPTVEPTTVPDTKPTTAKPTTPNTGDTGANTVSMIVLAAAAVVIAGCGSAVAWGRKAKK